MKQKIIILSLAVCFMLSSRLVLTSTTLPMLLNSFTSAGVNVARLPMNLPPPYTWAEDYQYINFRFGAGPDWGYTFLSNPWSANQAVGPNGLAADISNITNAITSQQWQTGICFMLLGVVNNNTVSDIARVMPTSLALYIFDRATGAMLPNTPVSVPLANINLLNGQAPEIPTSFGVNVITTGVYAGQPVNNATLTNNYPTLVTVYVGSLENAQAQEAVALATEMTYPVFTPSVTAATPSSTSPAFPTTTVTISGDSTTPSPVLMNASALSNIAVGLSYSTANTNTANFAIDLSANPIPVTALAAGVVVRLQFIPAGTTLSATSSPTLATVQAIAKNANWTGLNGSNATTANTVIALVMGMDGTVYAAGAYAGSYVSANMPVSYQVAINADQTESLNTVQIPITNSAAAGVQIGSALTSTPNMVSAPSALPDVSTMTPITTLAPGQTFFEIYPYQKFSDGTTVNFAIDCNLLNPVLTVGKKALCEIVWSKVITGTTAVWSATFTVYDSQTHDVVLSPQQFPSLYTGANTVTLVAGAQGQLSRSAGTGGIPPQDTYYQSFTTSDPTALTQYFLLPAPSSSSSASAGLTPAQLTAALVAAASSTPIATVAPGQTFQGIAFIPTFADGTQSYLAFDVNSINAATVATALAAGTPAIGRIDFTPTTTASTVTWAATITAYNASTKAVIGTPQTIAAVYSYNTNTVPWAPTTTPSTGGLTSAGIMYLRTAGTDAATSPADSDYQFFAMPAFTSTTSATSHFFLIPGQSPSPAGKDATPTSTTALTNFFALAQVLKTAA